MPPSNVLPLHLKQTFPPRIWIFTKGEGDGIESRLTFKIFSTLQWGNLTFKVDFSSEGYQMSRKSVQKKKSRSIISLIFTRKKFHLVLAWLLSETHGAAWQYCTVVNFYGFLSGEFTNTVWQEPIWIKVKKSWLLLLASTWAKRPRICINWPPPPFQTQIYLVNVPLNVNIAKQDLLHRKVRSERGDFNWCWLWSS